MALKETSKEISCTISNEDEKDDFFSSMSQSQMSKRQSLKSKAPNLMKTWLKAG